MGHLENIKAQGTERIAAALRSFEPIWSWVHPITRSVTLVDICFVLGRRNKRRYQCNISATKNDFRYLYSCTPQNNESRKGLALVRRS